jgi:deoxyribodipyrimidine photolyase
MGWANGENRDAIQPLAPDYPLPIVEHQREREKALARFKLAKSK